MQIEQDIKLDFSDVLIRPKRSAVGSRADVELVRSFTTLNSVKNITGIPICAANMDTVGTFNMSSVFSQNKMFTCLHKFYNTSDLITFFQLTQYANYVFYTTGITNEDINKLKNVSREANVDNICIDAANGYTKYFVERVRQVRDHYPNAIIMAGNVATPDMVQEILISGKADIVKIGIGPGSVCETRKATGVGYYQLSAIIECADAAHGLGGLICADGGCSTSGDICKALGAGADFVMLGSMLAGHDECDAEWETEYNFVNNDKGIPCLTHGGQKTKKFMKFYGMSSVDAMEKYYGGVADYRASEGKCIKVPYKGSVDQTIKQILGSVRSFCTYIGASKLKHASKCTTFVKNK